MSKSDKGGSFIVELNRLPKIQKIESLNTELLQPLVIESESGGFNFIRKLNDEYISGKNRFDKPGELLLIVEEDRKIIGVCGLNQDPYMNKAGFGRVRHLYVTKGHRNRGMGKALVQKIIEEAKDHFYILTLRTDNPTADTFYRSIGFLMDSSYNNSTHYIKLK
jgi:GNAT superfamily N-acetyltransferase